MVEQKPKSQKKRKKRKRKRKPAGLDFTPPVQTQALFDVNRLAGGANPADQAP